MKFAPFAIAVATAFSVPSMAQVTNVSHLSDVQPTEWSYQAISDLVGRYGCVAGFPDGTFQPGQPATRAQLAALVNSCLDRITEFQSAQDAQLAAALKSQAAKWEGTEAAVAKLELAAAKKAEGVNNYLGAGALINQQGTDGNGYSDSRVVAGATIQGRYAVKTFENENAVSVRPYVNLVGAPDGQIGAGGGALVSYDLSIAKAKSGVSKANVYAGAGYQVPFVNNTEANFQSAVGSKGQVVLAVGAEGRITNSLVGFADVKLPTTNAGNAYGGSGAPYSPVFTTGLGVKW